MKRWLGVIFVLLLPCLIRAAEPVRPPQYRITGVAVSSRDGSRIPYCRFQAIEGRPLTEEEIAPAREARPEGATQRGGGFSGRSQNLQNPPEISADVHGRFQIDLPGPGRWRIRGFARNFRVQDYDAHDTFFSSMILTPSMPTMDVVFKLVPNGEITGLVRDDIGEGIRNAQVQAEMPSTDPTRGAWRAVGFAQTDDRGHYEIGGLAPGSYRVRVQAQPWYAQAASQRVFLSRGAGSPVVPAPDPALDVVYAPVWFPGVDDESRAEPIQLAGGEEREADFLMTPIPAPHLKIPRVDPPAGTDDRPRPQRNAVVVKVSPTGGLGPSFSTTNGSETDFGGLSPGIYEIRPVGADGRADEDVRQFRVFPGTGGVIDLGTALPLIRVRLLADGVADAPLNDVVFVDTTTGRSVSSSNRQQFGGPGRRRSADDPPAERVAYLAPGTYDVYLPATSANALTGLTVMGASSVGLAVTITDGSPTLTLHLAAGKGQVAGRVMADGKTSAGTMVLLVPATLGQPGDLTPIRRDQTNTDGGYSIRTVLPGRYILVAIVNGWGLKWQDPATLLPYLSHGTPVEIKAESRQLIDLRPAVP